MIRYDENSEDDLVIADLDEQSTVRMSVLTFVPDEQIAEVTVQVHTEWKREQEQQPILALPDGRITRDTFKDFAITASLYCKYIKVGNTTCI